MTRGEWAAVRGRYPGVTRLGPGRYQARIQIGGRRHSLEVHRTPEAAAQVYAAVARELEETGESESLWSYSQSVIRRMRVDPSCRSAVSYERSLRALQGEAWMQMPLEEVRARHIREWIERALRTFSRNTVGGRLAAVRVVYRYAIADELVGGSPAADVRIGRVASTGEAWSYLEPDEQRVLLSCAEIPEDWRLMLAFWMGLGLRPGEAVSAMAADVDLRRRQYTVRFGGRGRQPTKSGKPRTLPLFGLALAAVQAWWPQRWASPHGLLWPGPRGGHRAQDIARWLRAAGLRHIRPHDLRHTCGASLISGWWGEPWPIERVKELMGHSSIAVTERYAHLAPSALSAQAAVTTGGVVTGGVFLEKNVKHARSGTSRGDRGLLGERSGSGDRVGGYVTTGLDWHAWGPRLPQLRGELDLSGVEA